MSAPITFQLWSHLEEKFCQTGETPPSSDPNASIFRSIVRANDARVAESWVIQRKADPLLALRAYVYRGRLKEASALAAQLAQGAETAIHSGEVLLEEARIAALDGQWAECDRICSAALALQELSPVSHLTVLQIRALARFEQGEMSRATGDLDQVDSLTAIFPNSPSSFYAAILRARIVARDRGPAEGHRLLQRLWADLIRNTNFAMNLDRIHALIRAELDLERLAGGVSPARLLASYRIAEITGEDLYAALAAFEAAHSGIRTMAAFFGAHARRGAQVFPKIRKLADEMEGRAESSTVTGSTISAAFRSSPEIDGPDFADSLPAISSLLLLKRKTLVQLAPFSTHTLDGQPQLLKAVLATAEGPILVRDFFSRVWGRRRYSPELHTNAVASLLYRLRRKTGARVRVADGRVHLDQTLVIS